MFQKVVSACDHHTESKSAEHFNMVAHLPSPI